MVVVGQGGYVECLNVIHTYPSLRQLALASGQLLGRLGTEPDQAISQRPRRGQHHSYDLGDLKILYFGRFLKLFAEFGVASDVLGHFGVDFYP
jgi:hypothetical protein